MLYLLDANVLIDANQYYYPIERVPEFWDWLLEEAVAGRVKIPQENYEEIVIPVPNRPDLLFEWVTEHSAHLVLDEEVDKGLVATVTSEGYARDLTDVEVEQIGRDPFLIAYALADIGNRFVISTEVSRPSKQRANRKIPDVCKTLNSIPCANTFYLIHALDFRTGR